MKPILIAAVIIVHLALLFYSIAILHQVRSRTFSKLLMATLSLGLLFDVVSTVCMVIGSGKGYTLHGFIGYSSLACMMADTIASWRRVSRFGIGSPVPALFNRWSVAAYVYWICAYITGALIVMWR